MTLASAPVLFSLVANLATDTIEVSEDGMPWVWVAVLVLAPVVVAVEMSHRRRDGLAAPAGLAEAAERLAVAVGAQWRREEQRQRVHAP